MMPPRKSRKSEAPQTAAAEASQPPTATVSADSPVASPDESAPAAPAKPSSSDWYPLHTHMLEIYDPIIWRQLLVPPTITTAQLRLLMVAAFGWAGGHMHMWNIRKVTSIDGNGEPIKSDLNPDGFATPLAAFNWSDYADRADDDKDEDDFSLEINHGLPKEMTLAELDDKYDLSGVKHLLHWEYDMGDSWEHIIMIEKRIPETEVIESGWLASLGPPKGKKRTSTGKEKVKKIARVTGALGHGVAEDAGSYPGWDHFKEAYAAKGTKKDDDEYEGRRDWYENSCGNGDPKGLKGKKRLEHFDVKEANMTYEAYSR